MEKTSRYHEKLSVERGLEIYVKWYSLRKGWNLLIQYESIFIHDSMVKRRKWIIREKRPNAIVTGSHEKTIVYGALSLDGKQLLRQYEKFE